MQAILLADRLGQELCPLDQYYTPCELPILGKSVLEHAIEEHYRSGFNEFFIVVNSLQLSSRNITERITRLPITVQFLVKKSSDSLFSLLQRFRSRLSFPLHISRADVIPYYWIRPSLTRVATDRKMNVSHQQCFTQLTAEVNQLEWSSLKQALEHDGSANSLCALLTIKEYHDIALLSISPNCPLTQHTGYQVASHLYRHPTASLSIRSINNCALFIDGHSKISENTQLSGVCYVGQNCYLDSGIELHNSLILDNTILCANLRLENSIVIADTLIKLTGTRIVVMATDNLSYSSQTISFKSLLKRVLSWPFFIIFSLIASIAGLFKFKKLQSLLNGFKRWKNNEVVLFGVTKPCQIDCAWRQIHSQLPKGLLNPALWFYKTSNDTERELREIEFYQKHISFHHINRKKEVSDV